VQENCQTLLVESLKRDLKMDEETSQTPDWHPSVGSSSKPF
jgi:hypothetical protein